MSTSFSRTLKLNSLTLLSRIISNIFWEIVFLPNSYPSSQHKLSRIWSCLDCPKKRHFENSVKFFIYPPIILFDCTSIYLPCLFFLTSFPPFFFFDRKIWSYQFTILKLMSGKDTFLNDWNIKIFKRHCYNRQNILKKWKKYLCSLNVFFPFILVFIFVIFSPGIGIVRISLLVSRTVYQM